MANEKKTLFENIWDAHVVAAPEGEPILLYIDLHLLHEVTSPQAFDGLRLALCRSGWLYKNLSPGTLRLCPRIAYG